MSESAKEKAASKEEKSQRQLEIEALRETRIPAGIPTLNLDYPVKEGYIRRIVCDRPGRLEKFYKGGWRFVTRDQLDKLNVSLLKPQTKEGQDSRISQVVGTHRDNRPMLGYLMEIPTELYDEDQALKMETVDGLEATLRAGMDADGSNQPGSDGRYVGRQGIKFQQKGGQPR